MEFLKWNRDRLEKVLHYFQLLICYKHNKIICFTDIISLPYESIACRNTLYSSVIQMVGREYIL